MKECIMTSVEALRVRGERERAMVKMLAATAEETERVYHRDIAAMSTTEKSKRVCHLRLHENYYYYDCYYYYDYCYNYN